MTAKLDTGFGYDVIDGPLGPIPIIEVDIRAVGGGLSERFWELSFVCPWGCKDERGRPRKHRHSGGRVADGPALAPAQWTGRASHCRQPGAPSSYELRLRRAPPRDLTIRTR